MQHETVLVDLVQPVRSFVIQNFLFGRDTGLSDDESFLETGIIDSTGILQLVAFLEKTYEIEIRDEELVPENLDSLSSISEFLKTKFGVWKFAL